MAGTTIKGVGSSGNVQVPDMVTAAKQNAGTSFQAVWNRTQSNTRPPIRPVGIAPRQGKMMSGAANL